MTIQDKIVTEAMSFQRRVAEWMIQCFTPEIIADKLERADRFIEEALELVQATGYSAERAHALVDYTFNRPRGEAFQEVGGVMVTLAALCNPHGLDMDDAAEAELARIWTKIETIRTKQATKPVGSALPMSTVQEPALDDDAEWLQLLAKGVLPDAMLVSEPKVRARLKAIANRLQEST